jgi:WD40 repeat protein
LWDPGAGRVLDRSIARLDHPASGICAFASLRRQGECVAVASDSHVTVWETDPLRLTDVAVSAPHGAVTSVAAAVSHGSTQLWVGDEDGCIAIHDPYTGQRHDLTRAHDGPVPALAVIQLTNTRSLVASGGTDGTIRLWDPQPGDGAGLTPAGSLPGHGAGVRALALPRHGGPQRLASSGADSTVRLWNLKRLAPQPADRAGTEHPVMAIVTAGRDQEQNRCLVTGHRNGMLQRHDPATGEPIGAPACQHPSPVQMMAEVPVPGGRPRVATIDAGNTIRLWDLGCQRPPKPPEIPAPPEAQPEPPALISELPCLDARAQALVAVDHDDGTLVAIGDSAGAVRIWDGHNASSPPTRAHAGVVTSMLSATLSDGTPRLVTAGSDQTIRLWTARRDDTFPYLTPDGPPVNLGSPVRTMTMLPTSHGQILAAGGEDGGIRIIDTASGHVLTTLKANPDTSPVAALTRVQAADRQWLLLGIGRAGALHLWRPDTAQHVHLLRLDGPIEAFHAFGSNLAIATRRGLSVLTLTYAVPDGVPGDAEQPAGQAGLARQEQQGGDR